MPQAINNLIDTNVQELVASNAIPTTFHGDMLLFGANLWGMTAAAILGVIVTGWMLISIVSHRREDGPRDPVTLYRWQWFCAGMGLTLRAGGAAAALWAWDPRAAKTGATVLAVQRHTDLASLAFASGWLVLLALSYHAMVAQLRKRPYPVQMMARIDNLTIPLMLIGVTAAAAAAVTILRSQAGLP